MTPNPQEDQGQIEKTAGELLDDDKLRQKGQAGEPASRRGR